MTENGTGTGTGGQSDEPEGSEADEPRIRQLDQATIDRIAAGEVVERPASAVKELLENALDAGSSRVSVAVESGGIEGIRVADNGVGMSEESVRRAIEKHTTSKIGSIKDLERGVSSLGFRGEALAAIAAVSELAIRTKPRGGTRGTELVVRGGEVQSVSPTGCPAGTSVEVTDLFYNVPARKKYLKQETTEFAHVNRVVTGYALANPDVAVSLEHDGRETFSTSGSGDLRETVLSTYGREVASAMISLDGDANDGGDTEERDRGEDGEDGSEPDDDGNGGSDDTGDTDDPLRSVGGLVSDPETTRANAAYVTTIVNGRYVTAKLLREAVIAAYGRQLAPDRYPFAVLSVELSPEKIDVNVHPRKMEVRFENEEKIRERVETRVEQALLDEGLVRSGAPRGRSAPSQTRIDPEPRGERPESAEGESRARASEPRERESTASRREAREEGTKARDEANAEGEKEPTEGNGRASFDANRQGASGTPGTTRRETRGTAETNGDGSSREHETDDGAGSSGNRSNRSDIGKAPSSGESSSGERNTRERATSSEADEFGGTGAAVDLEGVADLHAHIDERAARSSASRKFVANEQQALSGGAVDGTREFDRLPSLRVLGQFEGTYVVCETADGLVLIDQHAADERVTYERLREQLPRGEAQMLATPVTIELTAGEAALFDSHIDTLAGLGFYASWAASEEGEDGENGDEEIEDERTERTESGEGGGQTDEGRTVEVRTVPAAIFDPDPALLRDVLSAFVSAERPGKTIDAAADALLADLACYPSITANTSLSAGSMVDLLEELDACENPYSCPHGRPVVIEFGRGEIEARFERDYPGHAGRRSE